ncbi:serine hydrolase [Streptomyces lydicus]|uniref:D-alanyl-D-alanine carboxypeptidase n=1 Tax=Streptomyces lydicus TaxID=47763 RepID=A0A1D7VF19_9ACTN|nr:serine hydrolase [Streptomyces lydicus]AOP45330.1 D-alanyl-D-alanine carboxypeptidase [Streptomyces lydicus]
MAGESPDKSDKKQSSGEAAQSGRDPRLSVLRGEPDEPATETGVAEAAEDSGTPGKGEGPEAPERSETAQEAAGASADGEGDGEAGDGRLRDAVAAWVAGKGDKDGEGDAEEAGDGGDGEESGSESPASKGSASKGSGTKDSGSEASGSKQSGSKASGSKASVSEGGSEKAGSAKASSEESGSEGSGAVKGDSEGAAAKPTAKSDAKAGAKGQAKSAVKAGAKGEAKTGAKAAEVEAGRDAAAEAETDAKAEAETDAKAEAETGAKAGAKSGVESGAKVDAEPGAKAERKVVDQPTAVFKTVGAQKGASGAEGDAKADDAAGESGGGEAEDDGSAVDEATRVFAVAKGKGKPASGEAVDQATTAFKINPPAKGRSAEQSKDTSAEQSKDTSAEQANGKAAEGPKGAPGAKDADEAASKDKAKGKDADEAASKGKDKGKDEAKGSKGASGAKGGGSVAESDAERTSQFVALKRDDDSAAGRSLGKTAPRTPARTPGKDTPKEPAKETPKDAAKGATKGATKDAAQDAPAETSKGADKPAGKASGASGKAAAAAGALPAAAPAKPSTPQKPADRPGAMPPAADAGAAAAPAGLPESERTKQQPLPPLDLLAKLTNTPPPPETPLRNVVRRFKIWTPLAVLLAIIFVVVQSVRPLPEPALAVGGSAAFTFDGGKLSVPWPDQGQAAVSVVGVGSLGTSGQAKPVPTASVAKVMTAYVLLRDHPLKKGEKGQTITIDAQGEADSQKKDESRVPLKKDQQFNQYQMLQMLMIPSGNNVARQLARWDAGSEGAFVKKMNDAAKKLGMSKTTYTDPSGLDKATVSTAVDQLKLAEQVMKNDAFREVVRTENVQIAGLPEKIYNNNSLLTTMAGQVAGIKTGSSTPAGGTFMWASYRTVGGKDQLILGVTMDQHTNSPDPNAQLGLVLSNTEKVITAARGALVSDTVVKKGQVVGYVDDGLGGQTPVVATKDLSAVGWPGMKATFAMSNGGKAVPHEAKAGTTVGVLTVGNGESTQKVPVALKEDLVEPSFGAKLTRIG